MSGRLIAVVGPSGVGKDSLIAGIRAARPDLTVARRAITRPADPSEPFESLDEDAFDCRLAAGDFALHWSAHGLRYGIPNATLESVRRGQSVIANLSRGVLFQAKTVYGKLTILSVTASPEVLAARLGQRGRESADGIDKRLARPVPRFPDDADCVEIENDGPIDHAIRRALSALDARTEA